MKAPRTFPHGFLWGAATSAQQIEGAAREDGRGESIWDRFAATRGNIADGSDPSVACDHYHRWRDDVRLLSELGVRAYRFSVAWPRVQPGGRGAFDERGLAFYESLVDELLRHGIQPFPTLYHWDLPQPLQDRGGWGVRETARAFAAYADAVASRLGDRIRYWVTHNEPWCTSTLGHEEGHHAPGHRNPTEALRVAHHVLLSHAWATEVIRDHASDAEIGIVLNLTPVEPASPASADQDAARQLDGSFNRWFLDPLFHGRYPADVVADRVRLGHLPSAKLPFVESGDMRVISRPLDFLGLNYYSRNVVRGEKGRPIAVPQVPDDQLTDMGWEVRPEALFDLMLRLRDEYGPAAIYITENGAAYSDRPDASARIRDDRRIAFMRAHLVAAHRALEAGVPLRGYFAWSLMDNFEWAHGYAKRFGLYWVDYETQKRIAKDSARWYRGVIHENALGDAARELSPGRLS